MDRKKIAASFVFAFALAALSLAGLAPRAEAAVSLSAVGVLDWANSSGSLNLNAGSSIPTSASVSSGTTLGFGALIQLGTSPGLGFEAGVLYVPRKLNLLDSGGNSLGGTTFNYLEIPLLLRLNLPLVSVGLGPYYAHSVGSISFSSAGAPDVTVDYGSANVNQSDWGLEGSVAVNIPVLPALSVLVDGRYLFGIANQDSTSATTQHFRDVELLAGLTLSI